MCRICKKYLNKKTMNFFVYTVCKMNFILVVTLLSFLFICPSTSFCETFSIKGERVGLRTSPDQKAKTVWEYGDGFPLEVVKKQGDWLMVKDFENDSGWIHKSNLQKKNQVIIKANKDTEKTINIRSGPTSKDQIVGNAYYGVVFSVLEKKATWLQVRHESGLTGWVKTDFVWGL